MLTHTPQMITTSAAAEALAATEHASKTPLPARLSERSTPFTKLADDVRRWSLTLGRLLHLMQLHCEATSTPLRIAVTAGNYRKSDGANVAYAGGEVTLSDASTSRVYILTATNALTVSTSAWPATEADYVPIAEVTTSGGAVTAIVDRRTWIAYRLPPSSTDTGATNQVKFTIDADNAGAGADGGVAMNRGSSAAEDAMLKWIESAGVWRALALDATGTRAGLDAAKLQIGGSDVINSSGKLLAAALDAALLYTFGASMVRITPAGSSGAPSSGAHSAGELNVDSAGVAWVCTASGTPGTWARVADQLASPAAGVISAAALSNAIADKIAQVSVPDSTGGSPRTLQIQIKDIQGNDLAETVYLRVGVFQDGAGAAAATNATIAVGGVGTLVRSWTAGKDLSVATDATGRVDLVVTDGTLETVYVLAAPTSRSKMLDCSDIGTVTIA